MTNKEVIIRKSESADIAEILKLIQLSPDALLSATVEEIQSWIDRGFSYVGVTEDGEVVAHQAAYQWPETGWVEMRAAVVKPELRGQGINSLMKQMVMEAITAMMDKVTFVGFTEAASKSRGILQKMLFTEIPLEDTPAEFFTVCPADCYKKTGVPCGCKVFVKLPPKANKDV